MTEDQILHDEKFLPAAIDLVSKAKKRIYISTFKIEIINKPRGKKLYMFFSKLFDKVKEGVDVRVITNRVNQGTYIPRTNSHAIKTLKDNGVKVRYLESDRVCHSKIILVDDLATIIGSHNLSVMSCHSNFEISYITKSTQAIDNFFWIYRGVWERSKEI